MSEASADPTPQPAEPSGLPFRAIHYVYAAALLASSVAVVCPYGLVAGLPILGAWAYVIAARSRPVALRNAFVTIVSCSLLGLFLFEMLRHKPSACEPARRSQCMNNLKQISLALQQYHEEYGAFPPAFVADETGRPMHSWRVLLLPYLDGQKLYDRYDFREPWDGPNNSQLLREISPVYACPSVVRSNRDDRKWTSYAAVVGPRTAWPGPQGRKSTEFEDEAAQIIQLIECNPRTILWSEPRDLSFDEALRLLTSANPLSAAGHRREDFFYEDYAPPHILLANGKLRSVPPDINEVTLSALLRIDDGGTWPDAHIQDRFYTTRTFKWGNACRAGVFGLLALFPLPWVWLNPTSARRGPSGSAPG